ncbi:endonuclease/exonuclease/phosphatase family protein [Roseivivax halodurans]|uniref:endonuclease/exonuclease/phosphatase family protein n=1 Tax=Roseivivax halodurans TaxID=93683 RepID=UPI003CC761F4
MVRERVCRSPGLNELIRIRSARAISSRRGSCRSPPQGRRAPPHRHAPDTVASLARAWRGTIGQQLKRRAPYPVVLCGDLNERHPVELAISPRIVGKRTRARWSARFAARRPPLPLDWILAEGARRSGYSREHGSSSHRAARIGQRDAPSHSA